MIESSRCSPWVTPAKIWWQRRRDPTSLLWGLSRVYTVGNRAPAQDGAEAVILPFVLGSTESALCTPHAPVHLLQPGVEPESRALWDRGRPRADPPCTPSLLKRLRS